DDPLRIERISETHWRISERNTEPRVLDLPGAPSVFPAYAQVRIPGYENALRPGAPSLPLRALEFPLPPGAVLRVDLSSPREESFAAELAAVGGTHSGTAGTHSGTAGTHSGSAGTHSGSAGTGYTEILPVTERDGARIGGVRFHPVRYDHAARRLSWLRSCVLDVRVVADGAMIRSEWSENTASSRPSTRAGEERLRVITREEGIYRLSGAAIAAAGVDPATIDPALLRLTMRDEEIPLRLLGMEDGRVDAGDELRFHAPRKAGADGEYYDEWSDDNVCILSWSGSPGRRWSAIDAAPSSFPAAVPVTEFPVRLHLEEDTEYHRGDFEYSDMLVTHRVPGERWIWGYLLKRDAPQKQDSIRARFDAPAVSPHAAALRIRARGASRDTSMLRVTLNGTMVGEQRIAPYADALIDWAIPPGVLRATDNELVLTNPGIIRCPAENPACSIERLSVDWAELYFTTDLTGAGSPLLLDPAARHAGSIPPAEYRISISEDTGEILGYDIVRGGALTGIERAGGVATMVLDSAGRVYLHTEADILSPRAVERLSIPAWAAGATQADYLVVTHASLRDQAERLAAYRRQSDGYTTVVADVEDIYAVYNHGHKSPEAIRAFVEDAWERWPRPRPRFLLLMGDASWDAKQRTPSSTRADLVPTYGNPVSDNYYVSFTPQQADVMPSLAVGRIPAETPAQADAVIEKIIAYESLPPQPWDDRFLFSVGGENPFEQDVQLRPYVDGLMQLQTTPHCIEPRLIIKKTLDFVSYDDLDTLIHEVNQGVAWFFFVGHGGTRVIDVGVERPDIFDNEDKYIFFVTMSCNTAHFAEPFETGLNERFVLSPRNGAIATLGTSGLGILHYDYRLSRHMFFGLFDSAARTYGEIVLLGKRGMLASFGTGDQTAINTTDQVTLLGDPATRIPLARTPELAVRPEDLSTTPEILLEGTAATIRTRLHNDGLCLADSVGVELTVSRGGVVRHRESRRLAPFAVDTLLAWSHDFTGIDGTVEIRVTLDAEQVISEKDESNNSAVMLVNVLPRGIAQIFPLDRAELSRGAGSLEFLLANPTFVPDPALDPRVEIEYATDPAFAVGVLRERSPLGTVFTRLTVPMPGTDGVWYWRARMRTSGGSEQWSPVRSFTLHAAAVSDDWWSQTAPGQFAMTETEALEPAIGGGLRLGMRALELEAVSGGFNGPFKNAVLRVGDVNVSTDRRGFNLAVVEPVHGRLVDTVAFDTYEGRAVAAEMAAYVNGIPDDHLLLIAVRDDANGYPPSSPDGSNISPELRQALHAYGATLIDSVGFRDSYVLIGRRGDPTAVREQHFILGTAARRDTLITRATAGVLRSPVIGPVGTVSTVRWDGDAGSATARVDLRLIASGAGAGADGGRDSVLATFADVAPGDEIPLVAHNPLPSAFLRLEALVQDAQGEGSPVLRGLRLGYVSRFPELGITSQVVESAPDSVLEGEPITVRATVYNGGRVAADGRTMRLAVPGTAISLQQPLPSAAPRLDDGVEVEFVLPTAGVRGEHRFELAIDAEGSGQEYYRANNVYSKRFLSGRDGEAPHLAVTFDGNEIVNNDFVSPTPVIEIRLRDQSPLPVTDTSSVQIFLDGQRIWLMSDPRVRYVPGAGEEKLRVEFTPALTDGLHVLAVSGKDATGNATDTIPYQVRFNVSRAGRVDQVLPYPSPTTGPADFTFRVIGAEAPEAARVKIYTVAGRLIREIVAYPADLRIGFNRIPWDGRDADGDAIANGVYFFKLVLTHAGESIEQIGRFAVLR
ncbi:MAG: C25 family cysteine peptidase, partial [Bacteroidota bacterium]|nr:C25 family cysteine peptidase [Bacteroidota bacterium]